MVGLVVVIIIKGGSSVGDGSELLQEVNKADEWAMIDSITKATIANHAITNKSNSNAGELITGSNNSYEGSGAKSNADFAACCCIERND